MEKQWLTAVDGRPGKAHHALLWVDVEPVKLRHGGDGLSVRATGRRAWPLRSHKGPPDLFTPVPFEGPDSLAALLPTLAPPGKALTVWLARGWEDLVLTGLAELIDRGLYRHRWLTLDGQRVIARGALGKRRVDVTSLAAWTGGEWDGWRKPAAAVLGMMEPVGSDPETVAVIKGAGADERAALSEVLTVLDASRTLFLGPLKLSVGAQARGWWRAWGGPRLGTPRRPGAAAKGRGKARGRCIVAPVPRRPKPAASAESHVCHGPAREQYAKGHVKGRVHVLDLQSAYLVALACVQVPAIFERVLKTPSVADLQGAIVGTAGCALVRLERTAYPFSIRHHARPARAVGSYWCWLTEPDLCRAFRDGTVAECHIAWLWRHTRNGRKQIEQLLGIAPQLAEAGLTHLGAFWRQLYASCVGGWAQRSWEWIDVPDRKAPGRWLTWTMLAADGMTTEYWRCVGGRVQRRLYRGEAPQSLPLLYGTCTAHVRQAVDYLAGKLPKGSVLACACDALWLTDNGLSAWEKLTGESGRTMERWRVKEVFDDAWLDGRGKAVVRKGPDLFPLLPGIPAGVCIDAKGLATWPRAAEWDTATDVRPDKPLPRRRARWDGGRVMRENEHPLRPVSPWVRLNDPTFPESLLLPYDPCTAAGPAVD